MLSGSTVPLVLGSEKTYHFRTTPREDGRLLLAMKNGTVEVVGVKVGWTYQGDKNVVFDPLSKMTKEEISRLRGIRLDTWSERPMRPWLPSPPPIPTAG
jgi:hypothetical protein